MNATQAHEMHTMLTVLAIVIAGVFLLAMNPGWNWWDLRDRFRVDTFEGVTLDSAALTTIMPAVGYLMVEGFVEEDPYVAVEVEEIGDGWTHALLHALDVDIEIMIMELTMELEEACVSVGAGH